MNNDNCTNILQRYHCLNEYKTDVIVVLLYFYIGY